MFLHCAETLRRSWLQTGRFRDARSLTTRAIKADPYNQRTWCLLLKTLLTGPKRPSAASSGRMAT